jgi:enamine deaminase RidA (YjgF/YER057c/UK114 family)
LASTSRDELADRGTVRQDDPERRRPAMATMTVAQLPKAGADVEIVER